MKSLSNVKPDQIQYLSTLSQAYLATEAETVYRETGYKVHKESRGQCNFVLYNPFLFTEDVDDAGNNFLVYRGTENDFQLPINCSTLYRMFSKYAEIPKQLVSEEVVDVTEAFLDNSTYQTIDLTHWYLPNVETCNKMFNGAFITDVQLCSFPKVKNASAMFFNCQRLRVLTLDFGKAYNLENLNGLLCGCERLQAAKIAFLADKAPSMENFAKGDIRLAELDFTKAYYSGTAGFNVDVLACEQGTVVLLNYSNSDLATNCNVMCKCVE